MDDYEGYDDEFDDLDEEYAPDPILDPDDLVSSDITWSLHRSELDDIRVELRIEGDCEPVTLEDGEETDVVLNVTCIPFDGDSWRDMANFQGQWEEFAMPAQATVYFNDHHFPMDAVEIKVHGLSDDGEADIELILSGDLEGLGTDEYALRFTAPFDGYSPAGSSPLIDVTGLTFTGNKYQLL